MDLLRVKKFNENGLVLFDDDALHNVKTFRTVNLRHHYYNDPNCQFIVISNFADMISNIEYVLDSNEKKLTAQERYNKYHKQSIKLALEHIHNIGSTLTYFTLLEKYNFLKEFEDIAKDYFEIITKTRPIVTRESNQIHYLLKRVNVSASRYTELPAETSSRTIRVLVEQKKDYSGNNYYFKLPNSRYNNVLDKYFSKPFSYFGNTLHNIKLAKVTTETDINNELMKIKTLAGGDADVELYKKDTLDYNRFLEWIKNNKQ